MVDGNWAPPYHAIMTWFVLLGLAAVVAAIAAVTGIKPKGTQHLARTRMIGVARFALLLLAVVLAYLAYRVRPGG